MKNSNLLNRGLTAIPGFDSRLKKLLCQSHSVKPKNFIFDPKQLKKLIFAELNIKGHSNINSDASSIFNKNGSIK